MNKSTPGFGGLVVVVIAILAASFAAAGEFHETFTGTTYRDAAVSTTEWSTGAGEIRLFPFQGALRGVVPTAASHRDVAVDGHLIYAADFSNGMVVYSRNGTEAPVQVGHFAATGSAYAVACDGRHAYLGMGTDGLLILDVSDPAAIVQVGFIDPAGLIYDIAVDGQLVYLASYNGGVHVVDVSTPSAPVLRGSYTGVTAAYGVDVDGDRVYVSSYLQDVKILDVTNPASIVELGTYNTIGHNYGVCADGDRLYVADGVGGLLVLDVLDPSAPTLLGSMGTGGSTRSVDVTGDWILAADYNTGLALVDAYDPTSMNSRTVASAFYGASVVVAGGSAYVAGMTGGLFTFDVANRIPLEPVGGNPVPYGWRRMDLVGDVLWVACVVNGIIGLDLTDPEDPSWMGQFGMPGVTDFAYDVKIADDYAYVADSEQGILIVDVSDPGAPTLAGQRTGSFAGVEIAGDLLYALSYSGLEISSFSRAVPTALTPKASVSFAGYASNMTQAGDYLYVPAWSSGLRIYQLGPNGAMGLAGTYATTSARDVAVQGGIAYLADGSSGVRVLGVSNPASPILHTTVATGAAATTVHCDGADLFVGLAGGGVELWDVSVPLSPYKVTAYATADEVVGMVVGGDYLILGEDLGGLEVVAARQRRFEQDLNLTQSSVFAVVNQDVVQVRLTADSIETLAWEISANAGADWNPVNAGDWTAIDQPGTELKWRATHTVRFPRDNPSCSDLQIEWLIDAPVVTSISDVPNDQGRQVSLSWTRSGHDLSGDSQQVVEYAVYRRIETGAAGLAALTPDKAYPPGDWHFVMTVPADVEESYAVVAPTLSDSTAAGLGSATFFVRARTAVPGVYFDATPASGYSVDNLAPSVPSGLKMSTPDVLSWDESLDADFRYFTVYRSQSPEIDGSTVQIGQTIATSLDLTNQAPGYFLVTATDFAGNESGPAALDGVSPVSDLGLPQRTALIGNMPNPFNPATVIHFDLSGPSPVRLKVFDVSGREVRSVLAGATLPAGRHEARWDGRDDNGQAAAAGVYLYRLEAGSFRETRRMTLLK